MKIQLLTLTATESDKLFKYLHQSLAIDRPKCKAEAEKADELLNKRQKLLDHIQLKTNEAQAKLFKAREQNATFKPKKELES